MDKCKEVSPEKLDMVSNLKYKVIDRKLMELKDTMARRRENKIFLEKTSWIGEEKQKKLVRQVINFDIWEMIRVEIIIDQNLKNEFVDMKSVRDRIILIKLVLGEEHINILNAYSPQA